MIPGIVLHPFRFGVAAGYGPRRPASVYPVGDSGGDSAKLLRRNHTTQGGSVADHQQTPEQLAEGDRKADLVAILVIFTALVLGAVHFISGWTFHF